MTSPESPAGSTTLLLLNGLPASGKSTLAAAWCDRRPLSLRLDVDVVRGLLGDWLSDPGAAGLAARRLALAMATSQLSAGMDVCVPQFLARPEFGVALAGVAESTGARFVEVVLELDPAALTQRFADRTEDHGARALQAADADPAGHLRRHAERFAEYLTVRATDPRPPLRLSATGSTTDQLRRLDDLLLG